MKNDAAWLQAMANTTRRIAGERAGRNPELAYDLRALAIMCDAAALDVEDDDGQQAFAEEPTAPGRNATRAVVASQE